MNVAQNFIQPGKDAIEHDQALRGNIAEALEVPVPEVTPIQEQKPEVDEWEDRVMPNATTDKKGSLDILKDKWKKIIFRKPDVELKEAA